MKLLYLLVLLVGSAFAGEYGDYDRAQVLAIVPKEPKHIEILKNLHDSDDYDFWTRISRLDKGVDILVYRWQAAAMKSLLSYEGIPFSVKIDDVGTKIEESLRVNDAAREKAGMEGKSIEWTAYYSLEDIYAWMDALPEQYPGLVTVTNVGKTYEGRDIKLLKISRGGEGKPAVFSESTIHAREWIAPATVSYIINELLVNQTQYEDSLDAVDFYFVLVTNPDGYAHSWQSTLTRLWRKTRQPYGDCFGADPNRNFDFQWAEVGTSNNTCSAIFHGAHPYSEPCIQVLTDEIMAVAANVNAYIGFHSYAEAWLRPWGYQPLETEDGDDMKTLCEAAVSAGEKIHGLRYLCVLGGEDYQAGGVSDDWAYEIAGIKYSYTIELRDQGSAGFLLPPDNIIPSGQEVFASFRVVFEHVRDFPDDKRTT